MRDTQDRPEQRLSTFPAALTPGSWHRGLFPASAVGSAYHHSIFYHIGKKVKAAPVFVFI